MILVTSTRTINHKSTSPPKEKYALARNATNIIIYLYKKIPEPFCLVKIKVLQEQGK
jgi:hypothetical protein